MVAIALHDLARTLRGHKYGSSWLCHCPCHEDGSPSLALSQADNGQLLVYCHAGCNQLVVLGALRNLGALSLQVDHLHYPTPASNADVLPFVRDTWKQCVQAQGTPVETYLRHRGYVFPVPTTVRYHPRLRHTRSKQWLDAMVSAVTVAPSRTIVAIHRTYLLPDGEAKASVKPNRMMLGRVAGGAVRLSPAAPTMAIAEGIETALSVQQATGIPTWAALSASGIEKLVLPPLPLAREITIAADHDDSGVGLTAARAAAANWALEGRAVRIAMPAIPGMDFNDVLRGGNHV